MSRRRVVSCSAGSSNCSATRRCGRCASARKHPQNAAREPGDAAPHPSVIDNDSSGERSAAMQIRESVIVSAVRTPTGKFLGALKDFTAPELGALVVREAVTRAGIEPGLVDECLMGNVIQAGVGQNP